MLLRRATQSAPSPAPGGFTPGAPASGRERAQWALVLAARAGVLAHAAFLPVSIAGMQIGLAVAFGALLLLRATGMRVWTRTSVDLPVLLVTGMAVLSIPLAALAGSPLPGLHKATLWRSILALPVVLSALELEGPGEAGGGAPRRALLALSVWAGAALLPSLWSWVQFETGADLLHLLGLRRRPHRADAPWYPGHYAATGFFYWYTVFAQNLTSPLAVATSLALHGDVGRRRRLLLACASVAAAAAAALTFSRSAWLALAAAAVVVVTLGGGARLRIALPLTLAGFGAAALVQPGLRSRLVNAVVPSANADRLTIWRVCAAVVEDHPWTGVGFGNLHPLAEGYWDRLAPWGTSRGGCHDVFFSMLAEGGPLLLAATVAFFGLLAVAFARWLWRASGPLQRAAAAGGLGAIVALAVNGLFHDVFHTSEPMYAFSFAVAVAAVLARGRDGG